MPINWPDAQHIYLSPHLDDAVLSCGGTIYQQAQRGETVAVITVFAASPPDEPLSPFAGSLHDRWHESADGADFSDPPAVRRAEDVQALAVLGGSVQPVHYTLADCIYRRSIVTGEPLYASEEAIFGEVQPDDPALLDFEATPPPPAGAAVYSPLAIGHHVDHQIVYEWVRGWNLPGDRVRYYEDYPYAAQQTEPVELTLARRDAWERHVVPLSEDAQAAKTCAAAAYASQISTFWSSLEAMDRALREYAARVGGERYWTPAG